MASASNDVIKASATVDGIVTDLCSVLNRTKHVKIEFSQEKSCSDGGCEIITNEDIDAI